MTKSMKMLMMIFVVSTSCFSMGNKAFTQCFIPEYGDNVSKSPCEDGASSQVMTLLGGGITCRENYYYGLREGQTTYTFPFSQNIQKVELYSQNQLLKETTLYSSGSPCIEITYSPLEHTIIRKWYENGALQSFEKYTGSLLAYGEYYDQQGQCFSKVQAGNGLRTIRDREGTLICSDTVKAGKVDYVSLYYENGVPKEINPYVDGVVHGCRKTFLPCGEPHTIETWEDGKQQGITTLFINGERAHEIPYINGIKNGKSREYRDGEIVVKEVTWKNDKKDGPCHIFLEGGTYTEWYYKGNKVSKAYYDSMHPESQQG
jgi:antitoxin component YwqK of YwqJK toxin-antitoxin module